MASQLVRTNLKRFYSSSFRYSQNSQNFQKNLVYLYITISVTLPFLLPIKSSLKSDNIDAKGITSHRCLLSKI
ncbi:uncharacterized protein ASCRUDRAFT_79540 [Ascoidea rubescens DSM 1968]|uniref:Uncharacterized protein n=1 Tax=Ascoidea rubescens DSM 1968 TaxID=1344418 RepID=A0A1D2VMU4_9ASCO|nr:hypothetical protein ASCRUDRAFT_79540 [Ascoidea rubescens DSM 1968]ODV62919.1 hypothetical protein ASCRUDRAFT_79540 [Ascoidea rubescens DSM 1968]